MTMVRRAPGTIGRDANAALTVASKCPAGVHRRLIGRAANGPSTRSRLSSPRDRAARPVLGRRPRRPAAEWAAHRRALPAGRGHRPRRHGHGPSGDRHPPRSRGRGQAPASRRSRPTPTSPSGSAARPWPPPSCATRTSSPAWTPARTATSRTWSWSSSRARTWRLGCVAAVDSRPWAAARIGLDVARALGVAHVRGIVHRDIKPGNILLAADGRAMVTDFGIARLAMDAEAAAPGTTLGSVHYFSPEQARGTTTIAGVRRVRAGPRAVRVGDRGAAVVGRHDGCHRPGPGRADGAGRPRPPAGDARPRSPRSSPGRSPRSRPIATRTAPRWRPRSSRSSLAGDPAMPTASVPAPVALEAIRPPCRRGGGCVAAVRPRWPPPLDPPLRRAARRADRLPVRPDDGPAGTGSGARRPRLAVLIVVGGALALAARPADEGGGPGATDAADPSDPVAVATAAPSRRRPRRPRSHPPPRPTRTPTEKPTAVPPGEVADLCEPFFDLPCGLGAGRYAPSRFGVPFDVEIGEGWSTARPRHGRRGADPRGGADDVRRAASRPSIRSERPRETRDRARDLIEAVVTMDGVASSEPAAVPDRWPRRACRSTARRSTDQRLALFATGGSTYYLEPSRTTRIVAIDRPTAAPSSWPSSRTTTATCGRSSTRPTPAAGTIRWR